VVRFDARGLLPGHLFNVTWTQLEEQHRDLDLVFHGSNHVGRGYEAHSCWFALHTLKVLLAAGGPGSVMDLLAKHVIVPEVLSSACQPHILVRDVAASSPRWGRFDYRFGLNHHKDVAASNEYVAAFLRREALLDGNINVRRLPRWTRGELDDQEVMERIGLKGQVELAHNLLWFGGTTGGAHYDIQDNLLVQISGESTALVFPPNCSGGLWQVGGSRATVEWLIKQGRYVPYFVVPMKPGDGLVIPSNAVHVVTSKDPHRIDMNFFLEPKFGRMRWPSAPANYFTTADPGTLSQRALWLKTVRELWDTGAAGTNGFVIHGQRQELV